MQLFCKLQPTEFPEEGSRRWHDYASFPFISNESSNPEQADTDALGKRAPPPQFPLPTCSVLVGQVSD